MPKFRVSVTVEAKDIAEATMKFLYDTYAEPVTGILDIDVTEWA